MDRLAHGNVAAGGAPVRRRLLVWRGGAVAVAAVACGIAGWVAGRAGPTREAERVASSPANLASPIVSPKRSSDHLPGPVVLPELPSTFEHVPALTVQVELRDGGRETRPKQIKVVTRTFDRVHVTFQGTAREWLFIRNPVDKRRVSAISTDHPGHVLVEYDESELRNAGLGRGWADIVTLGVEPEALGGFQDTGREESMFGLRFVQKRPPEDAPGRIRELWWNEDSVLPLRVSIDDGGSKRDILVREIRKEIDSSLLRDPRERYPTYAVMDVSDYREKHHQEPAGGRRHD